MPGRLCYFCLYITERSSNERTETERGIATGWIKRPAMKELTKTRSIYREPVRNAVVVSATSGVVER